jgi:hypothetical protein
MQYHSLPLPDLFIPMKLIKCGHPSTFASSPFAPSQEKSPLRLREKKPLHAFARKKPFAPLRLREKKALRAFARNKPLRTFTPSREKTPSPLHAFARKQTYRAYVSTSKNSLIIIAVAPHTAFPSTQ